MLKDRARQRTRRHGRISAALVALAVAVVTSFSLVALAGAQESVGGSSNASLDSNTNTFTADGSTSPGGSCSGGGQANNAGTGGGGSCTTDQGSCTVGSGSATTAGCTTDAGACSAGSANTSGSVTCTGDGVDCSGSGGTSGQTGSVGGSCTTTQGSCSAGGGTTSSSGGGSATAGGECRAADAPAPPTISVDDKQTAEGNSGSHAVTFTLTLSVPAALPVLVHVKTADGTATTADGDYQAADAWALFVPGATTATASVAVNGDRKVEGDETFSVVLSNVQPGGAATIADGTGVGTIVNDDATGTGTGTGTSGSGGSSVGAGAGNGSASGSVSAGSNGQGGAKGSAGVQTAPRAAGPRCVVPNLRGMTVTQARAALRAANCRPGGRVLRPSAKVARGRVIGSTPKVGQSRRNGARVAMIVSAGKPGARSLRAKKDQLKAKKDQLKAKKNQLKQGKKVEVTVKAGN